MMVTTEDLHNNVFVLIAVNVGDEGGFAPNIQDNREGEKYSLPPPPHSKKTKPHALFQ